MTDIEKGKRYAYDHIKQQLPDYDESEFGRFVIGENFLSFRYEDITVSFVLTGMMGNDSIYECIYMDKEARELP